MKKILSPETARYIIAAFIILALVLIGISFIQSTTDDVSQQNKQYLSEVALQNASIIRDKVNLELDKLQAVANIIGQSYEFNQDYIMRVLQLENERSSYKRMAYVGPDGEAHTTDNLSFSILDRDYYEKALLGIANISDRLVDKIGGGLINVYAVPLYYKDEIAGVIIATSEMKIFSEAISNNMFGGEGFSYIIKENGTPVVYADNKNSMYEFDNLFEEMRRNGVSDSDIAEMKSNICNEISGNIEYTREGISRVAGYSKVGVNDWHIVSVVPKYVISEYSDRLIRRNILSVVAVAILLLIFMAFIFIQNAKHQRVLENLAFVDPITGSNNLNKFKQLAANILKEHGHRNLYMLRLDVDNFKLINDLYGFSEGDDILADISRVIGNVLNDGDIYGRIGSDDFIMMIRAESRDELIEIGRRFFDQFKALMTSNGKAYSVNFTTGVYIIPADETDIDKMMDRANMAHRSAKVQASERKLAFYDDTMRNDAVRIKNIENVMHDALLNNEFKVFLQPKYHLSTGKMEGAEALIRWIHGGHVEPPSAFVPVFEKNGFIVNIDLYVLEEVCKLQRKWLDMGITPVPISVNQSKPLVYGKDYCERISSIIAKYNLPPNLIELELLETIIHDNISDLIQITTSLHERGLLICIDDFGSGYSSLNMLKDLCVDVLKIDRGFLTRAENSDRAEFILSTIIALAKGLNMAVVTEGVETEHQADLLKRLECDTAQGYLYASPMPAEQFESKLFAECGV